MAIANVTELQVLRPNTIYASATATTVAAVDSSDADYDSTYGYGALVEPDGKQSKYLFVVENTSSSAGVDVKVKKGDHTVFGLADLDFTLAASAKKVFELDTARFMKFSGARKGKIVILAKTATLKISVYHLI